MNRVTCNFIQIFCFFLMASNAYAQFEGNRLSQAVDNTGFDVLNGSPGWEVTNSTSTFGGDSAVSSNIGDNQIATMAIEFIDTIGRGGTVTFDWKVSSEGVFDQLVFVIVDSGGVLSQRQGISGSKDWARVTFEISPGNKTLAWAYVKDGSLSLNQDRAWVDRIVIARHGSTLPPECLTFSNNLNSALDNNQLPIGGSFPNVNSPFVCQTDDFTTGGSAAKSPSDTVRFSTQDMSTTVTGPVDLIFDWKVSAGAEDLFELSIDLETIDTISGATNWTERRMSVPEGEHFVRWRYRRFSLNPVESNAGFVDHLRVAPFTNIREGSVPISAIINILLDEQP